jgi:hypothetical protein
MKRHVKMKSRRKLRNNNVVYQHATQFPGFSHPITSIRVFATTTMPVHDQEARIIIAIEAIRTSKRLSRRKAAIIYNVPESTLRARINGRYSRADYRPKAYNLTKLEEEEIVRYILDSDTRGFAPRLASIEDIVNYILESRGEKRVGKL